MTQTSLDGYVTHRTLFLFFCLFVCLFVCLICVSITRGCYRWMLILPVRWQLLDQLKLPGLFNLSNISNFYFFFNDLHQVNLGRPPFLFQVGVHFLLLVSTDSGGVFHQQRQSSLVKGILPRYLVLNLIQHAHMNCEIFHYYASYGWNSR